MYKIISTDFCLKERGMFFVNFCFRDSYYPRGFFHVRDNVYKFIQVFFQTSNITMNYASWGNCFTSQERVEYMKVIIFTLRVTWVRK